MSIASSAVRIGPSSSPTRTIADLGARRPSRAASRSATSRRRPRASRSRRRRAARAPRTCRSCRRRRSSTSTSTAPCGSGSASASTSSAIRAGSATTRTHGGDADDGIGARSHRDGIGAQYQRRDAHSAEIGSTSRPTRTVLGDLGARAAPRATRRSAARSALAQPDLPARPAAQPLERRRHRPAHLDAAADLGPLRDAPRRPARAAAPCVATSCCVRPVDPDRDQPAVRRIAPARRAPPTRPRRSSRSRAPRRATTAGALGPVRLDRSRGPADRRALPARRPARAAGTCAPTRESPGC